MGTSISRRTFVGGIGAASAILVVEGAPAVKAARSLLPSILGGLTASARMVRATDQLDVLVQVYGGSVSGGSITADTNTKVVFTFGPQHVAERHYASADDPNSGVQATHAAAGPSLVVLTLPNGSVTPFTLDGLLEQTESIGLTGTTTAGVPPNDVSALELPMGLILSPATGTRVRAARSARTFGNVAEVWAARLEPTLSGGQAQLTAIRNARNSDPVARIPNTTERNRIVTNTQITPLSAGRLWLTSAGAVADLRGDWPGQTLTRYRHTIHTGRDVFVETVTTGYLLPFGHQASIVTIAEREFSGGSSPVAPMRTRTFMTIVEPRVVSDRLGTTNDGLALPFTAVRASVDENDEIVSAQISDGTGPIGGAFTIQRNVAGTPSFFVDYRATDHNGDDVTFSLPATFVEAGQAFKVGAASNTGRLRTWFNAANAIRRGRRETDLGGQLVAFAPPESGPGTTSKQTFAFEFGVDGPIAGSTESALLAALSPAFFPSMRSAVVTDPTIGDRERLNVTMHPRYLTHGNGSANFDKVFLKLTAPKVSSFGQETPIRGVAGFDLVTEVFNQTSGVGLDRATASEPWDPSDALGAASKIIGGITLEDILDVVAIPNPVPGLDVPGLTVTVDDNTITTRFSFAPKLRENENVGFLTNPDTRAEISVTTIVSIDGETEPEQIIEACVYDFTLSFLPGASSPLVDVHFTKACALMSTSSGLDVNSDVSGVTLHGVLSYLADLFGDAGFKEPSIDVSDEGIDLGVTLKLPNISIGVLTIKGIKIDFGLFIPLQGDPGVLSIDVGTKAKPLTLAVMSFGGTFYAGFDIQYGPNRQPGNDVIRIGVTVFWEIIKIDMIIAKATVTLRLAADFELVGDEVTFVGEVAIEGYISFGGFIDVTLTAAITMTYKSTTEELVLKGTLFWDVDTPLGGPDGDVQLGQTTIEIGNGSGSRRSDRASSDASFGSIYSADSWTEYCSAFA